MTFINRTILITGGNSGIGQALAEALQAKGNRIIITGRKQDSLQATLKRNPAMAGICSMSQTKTRSWPFAPKY